MTYLHYIFIALEVILIFNLIIGVHEWGHFLAARWRGLKVERFAIWFGKPIWKKKVGDVEYVLGSIPFGGYVSLPQMASMEAIEGKTEGAAEQLPNVAPLDKIIVAFAGPLFSFALAIVFALIVWTVGRPNNLEGDSTQIGWVDPNGPAGQAGLHAGDIITSVDGHTVKNFLPTGDLTDSIKWRIITSTKPTIAINYTRDGKEMPTAFVVPTNPPTHWYERKALRQVSIAFAERSVVGELVSNSPAMGVGLQEGDEVMALNGEKIYSPLAVEHAAEMSTNAPKVPVTLTIKRGDQIFDKQLLAVRPVSPANADPSFGIAWQAETNYTLYHPSPFDQIQTSAGQILSTFQALFTPKSEIGVQQLGGAVMIGRVYANLFQDEQGFRRVLWFSVILNVNLALINLLPLPVLDGGHIMLSLIEMIRRRPVSVRLLSVIQNGFAALLIVFMIYIAFFDTGDWIRSARDTHGTPVFAPQK